MASRSAQACELLGAEGVVEAHHRHPVGDRGEEGRRRARPPSAVGESGTARSGCSASMARSSRTRASYSASVISGASCWWYRSLWCAIRAAQLLGPGRPGRSTAPAGRPSALAGAHRGDPRADDPVAVGSGRRGPPSGRGRPGAAGSAKATASPSVRSAPDGARHRPAVGAALGHRPDGAPGRSAGAAGRPVDPGHRVQVDRRAVGRLGRPDRDPAGRARRPPSRSGGGRRSPWPIPRRWPTVTSSTAVDRRRGRAPVAWSTSRPGVQRDPVRQEPVPALVGADEADVLAVGLGRRAQAQAGGLGPHLGLGQLPHREQATGPAGPGPAWTARRTGPWPGRRPGSSR